MIGNPDHHSVGLDECHIVERARSGDADAFTALVERYQQRLGGYLFRLPGRSDAAVDLTQEAFVRAWRALPNTQPQLHFRAWLFRIATNLVRDQFRRSQRIQWLPLETADAIVDRGAMFPSDSDDTCLRTLAQLRPRERTILLLCAVEELAYADAATVIGVTPEAARKQFTRAKERFRRLHRAINAARTE